jgi:hypothetical protein
MKQTIEKFVLEHQDKYPQYLGLLTAFNELSR